MIAQRRLYAHGWVVLAADGNFVKSCCRRGLETATFLGACYSHHESTQGTER